MTMFERYFIAFCILATLFIVSVKADNRLELEDRFSDSDKSMYIDFLELYIEEQNKIIDASVSSEFDLEETNNELISESIENRNAIVNAIVKIVQKIFVWAVKNCIFEAANKCKNKWRKPKKFFKCAKQFFVENQGRCALG